MEITHYQSLKVSEKLQWIDITEDKSKLCKYALDAEHAMTLDAGGEWLTGAYGFAELRMQLP